MSLLFDPRTSAIAAYMMNPMLYGAAQNPASQNSEIGSANSQLAQLAANAMANQATNAKLQQEPNNKNSSLNQQQAFMAMANAAQQAAALNFLTNGNSSKASPPLTDTNSLSITTTNDSKSPASATSNGFRILDLLEESSRAAKKDNSNQADLLAQNPTAQFILNAALQHLAKDRLANDTFGLNAFDVPSDHVRGTKRPYPQMTISDLREDGSGAEDGDDCSVEEDSSPRSSSMAPTPNGSSLNGSMLNQLNGSAGNSNSGGGSGKKARKARTIFTDKQLQELENNFDKHKYLSVQDRMDLAQRMGLSDTQVKTWYQNRRTKWKRQAAVGVDLLQEASNLAAVQNLIRTNPYWAQCMSNPFFAQRLLPLGIGGGGMNGAGNLLASMGAFNGTNGFPNFQQQNSSIDTNENLEDNANTSSQNFLRTSTESPETKNVEEDADFNDQPPNKRSKKNETNERKFNEIADEAKRFLNEALNNENDKFL